MPMSHCKMCAQKSTSTMKECYKRSNSATMSEGSSSGELHKKMLSNLRSAAHGLQRLTLPARSLDLRVAMENHYREELHHSLESCSFSSVSLSSISHISSSVSVFFFLPSFNFFSRSLIAFLASFALSATFFLTSILLPAPSYTSSMTLLPPLSSSAASTDSPSPC